MLVKYLQKFIRTSRRRKSIFRNRLVAADVLETRQLLSAVTVQIAASKDNTIYQSNPDASNGSGEFILAGDAARGLVQFDVGVPSGSTVIDAVLTLHSTGSGGGAAVSVHKVTTPWGASGSNAAKPALPMGW